MAFYDIIINVLVNNMTCYLEKADRYYGIKNAVKQELKELQQVILGYTEDQVFFCNLNGITHSFSFYIGTRIALSDYTDKFISWFHCVFGHSNRLGNFMVNTTFKI
ncbi:Glyceraldehyde-3-phosphate dehydrogenase [Tupaia chinensis]|uniref:glyceraldehyde-3-phosphate dehydrogenase (phosphorylating) n=1 Tax=Tupaia chinensis TaxID=246437 RepID=L9JVN2_TUPCH|nr:Glyceraldehyde-3-phosphate dehydrogenase [Tupaia chinensis]